ncbi:hypothetical protein IAT38_006764 [Cryptococcus sp. DSM 104549]
MPDHPLPPFLQTKPPPTAPPSQARLQALYASTATQRATNPTGYAANTHWWAGVLEETLRSGWVNGEGGDRLVVKVDEGLLGRWEDGKGARPRGVGGVVETLSTTTPPTLHPLPHFFASPTPLHAPASLTSRFVGRPLWWALSQLNPFGSASPVVKEDVLWNKYGKGKEYVHMQLLEQSAAAFTAYMLDHPLLSYTSSLFDIDSFLSEYAEACIPVGPTAKKLPKGKHALSRRDVEVLVKWLSRDCGLVVSDGSVIKVLDTDQVAADHPTTEADRGAVSVLNALRKVEKQILGIEDQITQSHEKAKKHLAAGQKNIALSYLRSKKQLEDLLAKRVGSSEQLRAVVRSIDQAKGDVEIMAAYETSTATLTSVLSHPSLSADRIAETTDALADAMADQEEIDQAVRVGGEVAMGGRRADADVDEEELASELAGLVEEERKEQEREKERVRVEGEKERERKEVERVEREKERARVEAEKMRRTTENAVPRAENPEKKEEISEEELPWRQRYEEAQARKQAEKERFEAERAQREAKRVAAE